MIRAARAFSPSARPSHRPGRDAPSRSSAPRQLDAQHVAIGVEAERGAGQRALQPARDHRRPRPRRRAPSAGPSRPRARTRARRAPPPAGPARSLGQELRHRAPAPRLEPLGRRHEDGGRARSGRLSGASTPSTPCDGTATTTIGAPPTARRSPDRGDLHAGSGMPGQIARVLAARARCRAPGPGSRAHRRTAPPSRADVQRRARCPSSPRPTTATAAGSLMRPPPLTPTAPAGRAATRMPLSRRSMFSRWR